MWRPLSCALSQNTHTQNIGQAPEEGWMERPGIGPALFYKSSAPSLFCCLSLHTPHHTPSAHSFICSHTPEPSVLFFSYPHTLQETPSPSSAYTLPQSHLRYILPPVDPVPIRHLRRKLYSLNTNLESTPFPKTDSSFILPRGYLNPQWAPKRPSPRQQQGLRRTDKVRQVVDRSQLMPKKASHGPQRKGRAAPRRLGPP